MHTEIIQWEQSKVVVQLLLKPQTCIFCSKMFEAMQWCKLFQFFKRWTSGVWPVLVLRWYVYDAFSERIKCSIITILWSLCQFNIWLHFLALLLEPFKKFEHHDSQYSCIPVIPKCNSIMLVLLICTVDMLLKSDCHSLWYLQGHPSHAYNCAAPWSTWMFRTPSFILITLKTCLT